MSDDPEELKKEVERLRAENLNLDEQVKLLVQTEQRLYRARTDLDRQLRQTRALGDFALRCSSVSTPRLILKDALEVLFGLFDIDLAVAIRIENCEDESAFSLWQCHGEESEKRTVILERDSPLNRWLAQQFRATSHRISGDSELQALIECMNELVVERDHEGAIVAVLPIRPSPQDLAGFIVLRRLAGDGPSFYLLPPDEESLPYLQLVARHVSGALGDIKVTDELRVHSMTLSERNEALQQSLTQTAKMEIVGQLAGGIAHDFNNLLTVILGSGQLLRRRLRDFGVDTEDLEEIIEAGERAAALTRQLLAFSRQQQRRIELVDVNEVVRSMSKMLRRLLGENYRFETSLDPRIGAIRSDRGQLEQVLLNLAVNARDALANGGSITVVTEGNKRNLGSGETECVTISVIDNGHGMDENTRSRIFEPFFTTKVGHGTGMGLAMVYGIVTQGGGEITVSSSVGRGARFDVHFPVCNVIDSTRVTRKIPAIPMDGGGETILLVEDEVAIRRFGERVLSERGYQVAIASSAEEALEAMGPGNDIDLLITDVVMPGLNGVELAERLREIHPALQVLYMSGYTQDILDAQGVNERQEHYLPKPFTGDTLLAAVAQAVSANRR